MPTSYQTVEEYIAAQPEAVQEVLSRVRMAIRAALPRAEESISYGMPTYTMYGARLLYFSAWKQHYSLYAATAPVLAAFHDELAAYKVDKGTIRFPFGDPVPAALIGRIAKFRAKEARARQKAEATTSPRMP